MSIYWEIGEEIYRQQKENGWGKSIVIGRNPKNLFATKDNLFELISEVQEEQTVLKIKSYL